MDFLDFSGLEAAAAVVEVFSLQLEVEQLQD